MTRNSDSETSDLRATNNLARIWVILSAGVLILGPFGSIPGIVLGRRALAWYQAAGVEQGQAMAKAAIWIGWIGLTLLLLACIASIVWLLILNQQIEAMNEEFFGN